MMTTSRLTHAARILADVVDAGLAAGLPAPFGISSLSYARPDISVSAFEDVAAWAEWLGVAASTSISKYDPEVEFCEAEAVCEGLTFRVVTNRRLAETS